MGNSVGCFSPKKVTHSGSKRATSPSSFAHSVSRRCSSVSKPEKEKVDEVIMQHAVAAALLYQQHGSNGAVPFDRSASVQYQSSSSKRQREIVPRSSSSRQRSLTDSLLQPHQLLNQDTSTDSLETKHFVLIHGGGFGAWCWYKVISLLQQNGYKVDAVDLTGSGIHSFDTNNITSLSQYVKPLTDFLEKLGDGEKVILVGHDFGGVCISYAMEQFPSKVAKAVFIAAAMLCRGQNALDMFSQLTMTNELMRQAQVFLYGEGKDHPPTAIDLDKASLKELLFNRSPDKDTVLASVSMRPTPFAPVLEKLSLSDSNYGSVRRFYIKTEEDCAIPVSLQEIMINSNPPEHVFQIKGSDHSPFFSKPQALHRLLLEISKIPPMQVS